MNKRIFALLMAALLLLTASGCSKSRRFRSRKTADILATTQPVYQLASALTDGTGLSVSLLISEPVSCLHDYTLTVAQMEKIEGAQLVLESGLGLEDFMEGALSGKTRIDISSGLSTLTRDEGVDPPLVAGPHALPAGSGHGRAGARRAVPGIFRPDHREPCRV